MNKEITLLSLLSYWSPTSWWAMKTLGESLVLKVSSGWKGGPTLRYPIYSIWQCSELKCYFAICIVCSSWLWPVTLSLSPVLFKPSTIIVRLPIRVGSNGHSWLFEHLSVPNTSTCTDSYGYNKDSDSARGLWIILTHYLPPPANVRNGSWLYSTKHFLWSSWKVSQSR